MNHYAKQVANALLFQLGWLACVMGGNQLALIVTVLLLGVHLVVFSRGRREWWLITGVGLLGVSIDSVLTVSGVFTFNDPLLLIPLWLCCLWLLFACTLNHSLGWLKRWPILAILLGAVAGPMSYYGGSHLADVQLASPLWYSLAVIAIIWSILLPLLLRLFHYLEPGTPT